jgi:hypothetical protein
MRKNGIILLYGNLGKKKPKITYETGLNFISARISIDSVITFKYYAIVKLT